MFRDKKTIIFLIIFFGVVFAISYFPQKNVKEDRTSVFGTDNKGNTFLDRTVPSITDKERNEYYLNNPFTDQDLMPFAVQSDTAILFDVNTGEVLYSKHPNTKKPTASISKIMTAIVVLENSDPETLLTVSQTAADITPNKIVMNPGEQMKIDDLMYGLMMISANDAAEALAEGVFDNRDRFIEEMNKKVDWLELKNTNFANPSGLDDPNHFSTPQDMGVITRYALKKHPEILNYMGKDEYSVYPTEHNESHWWQHVSYMLSNYEGMDGVKTGYTWDAGNTFLGTAKRGDKRLAVILFNSQNANDDVRSLFDYGFRI